MPTKLQMKRVGPCKVLEKYGTNSYKVDLPSDLVISYAFNVNGLVQFKGPLPANFHNKYGISTDLEPTAVPSPRKLEA